MEVDEEKGVECFVCIGVHNGAQDITQLMYVEYIYPLWKDRANETQSVEHMFCPPSPRSKHTHIHTHTTWWHVAECSSHHSLVTHTGCSSCGRRSAIHSTTTMTFTSMPTANCISAQLHTGWGYGSTSSTVRSVFQTR